MSQFIFPPLTASLDSEAASGTALPTTQMITGGYHSAGSKVYPLAVDADGQLQVDIVSTTGPSNYATDTLQTAGNAILTTIDTDTGNIAAAVSGTEMQVDVVAALPAGTNAIGKLAANSGVDIGDVTLNAGTAEIGKLAAGTASIGVLGANSGVDIGDVTLNAGTAEIGKLAAGTAAIGSVTIGTSTGVDIGAVALLAGTNAIGKLTANSGVDIGDVDVTSSALPSGAATSALQTAGNNLLTTIDADTSSLAGAISGTEMQVDIVAALPAGTNEIGKLAAGTAVIGKILNNAPVDFLDSGIIDTSTANIATGGTTVVASLAAACKEIEVVDDIGEYMSMRVGGAVKAYLPLGGGSVQVSLSATDAVQLYSETGTAIASGSIAINFLG